MQKVTAIYVRVSHRDQSHASQLPDLERWAEADGGPVKWYKDTFTGRTMNRPGMDRLLADLHAGKLTRIVVWRWANSLLLGVNGWGAHDSHNWWRSESVDDINRLWVRTGTLL